MVHLHEINIDNMKLYFIMKSTEATNVKFNYIHRKM